MMELRANRETFKSLAKELQSQGIDMEAIQMYTLAIYAYDQADADCYFNRAVCYEKIELFINATEDLQAACDLRPYP